VSEDISQLKQQAAEHAVEFVESGMVVGLATDVIVASDQGIRPVAQ